MYIQEYSIIQVLKELECIVSTKTENHEKVKGTRARILTNMSKTLDVIIKWRIAFLQLHPFGSQLTNNFQKVECFSPLKTMKCCS